MGIGGIRGDLKSCLAAVDKVKGENGWEARTEAFLKIGETDMQGYEIPKSRK